ncbi:unnamed protein product [Cylicostephanus goldi]|uniref:Uncharacterized protein n=1 Tax=Cylicostephanus goldi TaxID=71465 RepID=A0A3P6S6R9_CYLGO|nr:unnamed protein product [Cylicostephanus goldi]
MKITEPAYKIQQYSARLNERGGRDERLENLPSAIESILLDFMEDVIGYGHHELKAPAHDMSKSRYFASLGKTEGERHAKLKRLSAERRIYRKVMFKALQMAMRDVRSYDYDRAKMKWIPNDKKKRAVPAKQLDIQVEPD